MKKIVLFSLATLMTLPACSPDEELIEPTTLIDQNIVGQWRYSYWSSNDYEYVEENYSYFFLPDGNGYLTRHSDFNDVFPFMYQTFDNSLFIQFVDYGSSDERAFDYSYDADNTLMYWREIEDLENWARLERY